MMMPPNRLYIDAHTNHARTMRRPETKYRRKLLQVCPGEELLNCRLPPTPQQLEAYVDKVRKLLEHAAARCVSSRRPKEWSEEEPPLLDAVKVAPAVQVGMRGWMKGCMALFGWLWLLPVRRPSLTTPTHHINSTSVTNNTNTRCIWTEMLAATRRRWPGTCCWAPYPH